MWVQIIVDDVALEVSPYVRCRPGQDANDGFGQAGKTPRSRIDRIRNTVEDLPARLPKRVDRETSELSDWKGCRTLRRKEKGDHRGEEM